MTLTWKISSAAAGLAAASAGAFMVSGAGPRIPARSPAGPVPVICVGADSVLRAGVTGCAAGETTEPIETSQTPRGDDAQVAELETRLAALEQYPLLEVVDREANVVLAIGPDTLRLYSSDGHTNTPAVTLRATSSGGGVDASSVDGTISASVGATAERAGVVLVEGGVDRIEAGRAAQAGVALRVRDQAGVVIAGAGESKAGTGLVIVADSAGHTRASLTANGGGAATVFSTSGAGVGFLGQIGTGSGALTLADRNGEIGVKMSGNGRYGAVLTGPVAGSPYVPASGLPGSYFLGCAGGDACRPQ